MGTGGAPERWVGTAAEMKAKTIMANIETWTTQKSAQWQKALDRYAPYDFYHLPEYHVMAEEAGEGTGHLFVYEEGAYTIALPLLLRDVDANWRDATSVYGYAGPVRSHAEIPDAVARNFRLALTRQLRDLGVVTVFSRLHPLLRQRTLLSGLGDFQTSRTVAIDLTLDPAHQRSQYRRAFKKGINKLRRLGLTVVHDVHGAYLDDFVRIYYETMCRVEASERYFFSSTYLHRLWESLGSRINLFVCLHEGQALCAGLFMACHGIVQYHLGGTLNEALKLAPDKLLVDEVRLWANGQGHHALHLGGGTTADPADSLLHYKMGFSDTTCEFATWRWILAPEVYDRLCKAKAQWNERHQLQNAEANFFPAHRCPTLPCGLTSPARTSVAMLEPGASSNEGIS